MGNYLCKDSEHAKEVKNENRDGDMLPATDKGDAKSGVNILADDNPDIPFADSVVDDCDQCSPEETVFPASTTEGVHDTPLDHPVSVGLPQVSESCKHEDSQKKATLSRDEDQKEVCIDYHVIESIDEKRFSKNDQVETDEHHTKSLGSSEDIHHKQSEYQVEVIEGLSNESSNFETKDEHQVLPSVEDAHEHTNDSKVTQQKSTTVDDSISQDAHQHEEHIDNYQVDELQKEQEHLEEFPEFENVGLNLLGEAATDISGEITANKEDSQCCENGSNEDDDSDDQNLEPDDPSSSSFEYVSGEELKKIVSETVESVIKEAKRQLEDTMEASESQDHSTEPPRIID